MSLGVGNIVFFLLGLPGGPCLFCARDQSGEGLDSPEIMFPRAFSKQSVAKPSKAEPRKAEVPQAKSRFPKVHLQPSKAGQSKAK